MDPANAMSTLNQNARALIDTFDRSGGDSRCNETAVDAELVHRFLVEFLMAQRSRDRATTSM